MRKRRRFAQSLGGGRQEIEVVAAKGNKPVVHVLESNHFLLCIYDQLFAAHDDDDDDCDDELETSNSRLVYLF